MVPGLWRAEGDGAVNGPEMDKEKAVRLEGSGGGASDGAGLNWLAQLPFLC